MRIATWNINSVRMRLPLALGLLTTEQPDVLCLQEIKALAEQFPAAAFAAAGYPHQAVVGLKGYNGVAVISRLPPEENRRCELDWHSVVKGKSMSVRVDHGGSSHVKKKQE